MRAALPLLLLLPPGCPHTGGGSSGRSAREWAPPPGEVTYTRVNVAADIALPDKSIRLEWSGPAIVDDRVVYDVTTWDASGGEPRAVRRERHFYDRTGYGYLGTLDDRGHLEAWEPPQVVLPPRPEVGDAWSATHAKGDRVSERACEILASDLCPGGLVSVCESDMGTGRIVLRDHFCPGAGWSGFEALIQKEGQPTVRMWTRDVARDGVALPPAPDRGYASPAEAER